MEVEQTKQEDQHQVHSRTAATQQQQQISHQADPKRRSQIRPDQFLPSRHQPPNLASDQPGPAPQSVPVLGAVRVTGGSGQGPDGSQLGAETDNW